MWQQDTHHEGCARTKNKGVQEAAERGDEHEVDPAADRRSSRRCEVQLVELADRRTGRVVVQGRVGVRADVR